MTEKTGFNRIIDFLGLLRSKKLQFKLEQQTNDAIMVSFSLVGRRVEVQFFEDHLEFSEFLGRELIDDSEENLMNLVMSKAD